MTSLVGAAAPPYWAAGGAAATLLTMALICGFRRLFFPKRRTERPRRSLANAVTWICAAAAVVISGQGVFEVIHVAAPDVPWLPWLGVFLLEGPLLAFALRAKEAVDQEKDPAGAIRMTWVLAGMSAAISATSTMSTGSASVFLLRAITPIVGVILWHHALSIEQERSGATKSQSRWKWTPEYLLTRLGLVTAKEAQTADAEVHMRLTKVADWVIRYARAVERNTTRNAERNSTRNTRWSSFCRVRLERIYRAAERDLNLTQNADRRALLEQIIMSRSDAVLLTTLAGVTRADLGLSETEQPAERPARNTRIVFHKPVEQPVRNTRILFHKQVVEQPVERPSRGTRIVFRKPVEHPTGTGRNTSRKEAQKTGGTAGRNGRNGSSGTPERNGGTPDRNTGAGERNGDGKPTREEIFDAIRAAMKPSGEVPIRPLATQLGIPQATLHRHVTKYREEHGPATPSQGVIPPPRANGHPLSTVGSGDTN
ncbi:hypothetical protein ACIHFD_49315 [Nonomuraea sp. NPDC051941]|uniref:hypothetical protein n=1 Tax=Nonomuraea sp. NPDC051941 TaxID=3364373 RepID=UPI0037C8D90B